MTGKSNTQLLIESPEAMRRFLDALEREATLAGIEAEIEKLSESLREQLSAARACGLDPGGLAGLLPGETARAVAGVGYGCG